MAEQIIKNLTFCCILIQKHPVLQFTVPQEEDQEEEEDSQQKQTAPLYWIFRRLSAIARQEDILQKSWIFKWFAAMATKLKGEVFADYLIPSILPLYNINEKIYIVPESLQELVENVVQVMKDQVGVTVFFEKYNQVRDMTNRRRSERRAERSFEAAANPQKAIQKQTKRKQKKKASHKRKLEDFRKTKLNPIKVSKLE
eukprot:TRINITY_DN7043_c0_g1_i2.p1 TRINITY_DN7043_c0_g1~~TRINITY_DN7043_c0_g1_i2.p1  ORF type:complete len:230 (-),score=60.69 TRINITY_DN7043_c0_g1_i2:4-600(-)